jgi:DtxR family Mn-dependent transcriptional regulator
MFSLSEENYLKAIFHLQNSYKNGVSTNALAEEMQTKASSVTDMIKRLSEKSLVNYKKYQGVKLSEEGRAAAIEVIRKHRLWEVFLVEKLNFNWDEVHEVAEQLEHIKSEKLTAELDRFLGFPQRDPHGDPIPDSEGNFSVANRVLLSELKTDETGICVGVKDSSTEFLQYLDKNNISLGATVKVKQKEDFDQSMLIEMDDNELMISNQISANLYIKTT